MGAAVAELGGVSASDESIIRGKRTFDLAELQPDADGWYDLHHGLGTRDVIVSARENAPPYRGRPDFEVEFTNSDMVRLRSMFVFVGVDRWTRTDLSGCRIVVIA